MPKLDLAQPDLLAMNISIWLVWIDAINELLLVPVLQKCYGIYAKLKEQRFGSGSGSGTNSDSAEKAAEKTNKKATDVAKDMAKEKAKET